MHKSRVIGFSIYFPFLHPEIFFCTHLRTHAPMHVRMHTRVYAYHVFFHSNTFSLNVNCLHLKWNIPLLILHPCMYLTRCSAQFTLDCFYLVHGAMHCACLIVSNRKESTEVSQEIYFSYLFLIFCPSRSLLPSPHLLPSSLFPSPLLTEWDTKTEEISIYNQ